LQSDVGVSLNRTYQRDWEGTKRDPEYIKQFNKDVRLGRTSAAVIESGQIVFG
jgi:hypothetical protein